MDAWSAGDGVSDSVCAWGAGRGWQVSGYGLGGHAGQGSGCFQEIGVGQQQSMCIRCCEVRATSGWPQAHA